MKCCYGTCVSLDIVCRIGSNDDSSTTQPNPLMDKVEKLAIKYCDTEKPSGCLTWNEVQNCVDEFKEYLEEYGIPAPTKEMFIAMAHVEDGVKCLSFEDWKKAQASAQE